VEDTAIFVVITGGPSVGKTTIITLLRERGYKVVDELATQIIKEGKVLPWVDRHAFQKEVLRRQMEAEAPWINSNDPVFFDRGLFDGEAYYIADGLPIPHEFQQLPVHRYGLALLIEELPFFDNNGVRFEDLEFTRRFTPIVESCYTRRGIPVERIAAKPPEERVDLVIQTTQRYIQSQVTITVAPALAVAI
jgi:predicted ATPase